MVSKPNHLQLLSALAETLEKSRQHRSETVEAVSTLRSHLTALTSFHNLHATDSSLSIQRSSMEHSECYSELLLSKYRENCSRLQQDLLDTKAKLSASESHVQELQVQLIEMIALAILYVLF
jgi:hypothetical protein